MRPERRRRSIFELMHEYMDDFDRFAKELMESAAIIERPSWDTEACTLEPLYNIFITPDEAVVTVDLPYTEPQAIKVEAISEDQIEITAKMKRKVCFDDFGITHRKGEFSSFRCQARIPVPIDTKRMKIQFKRGILEIRLPRRKGYKIRVK